MSHIVIIGNGITGITCARNIRKADPNAEISVISAESDHFYSRTALMYIYMGHMKYEHTKPYEDWFWEKNRIKLIKGRVRYIGTEFKALTLEDGAMIHYSKLIIASGSKPNKFSWPGQDLKGVQGLYSIQDVESMNHYTSGIEHAVVVGGGLIGIEMAEMLLSRCIKVTFLVREKAYWDNILPTEEAELVSRHIKKHHINLLVETELKEIISDENGRVKSIITGNGEEIKCQFVGLTAGVSPSIEFLKDSGIKTNRGVLINEYLETSIPNIYAAGDCAEFIEPKPNHPSVEQLWYTGKMQAEALSKTICGKRTGYDRGIWFNSAKFLDIEYQTYGLMFAKLKDDEDSFYWEHPNGQLAFRATYKKSSRELIGFNFLGMRFRQEVADEWIRNKKPVDQAIRSLNEGWFDPEFFKAHYLDIQNAFAASTDFKKVDVN